MGRPEDQPLFGAAFLVFRRNLRASWGVKQLGQEFRLLVRLARQWNQNVHPTVPKAADLLGRQFSRAPNRLVTAGRSQAVQRDIRSFWVGWSPRGVRILIVFRQILLSGGGVQPPAGASPRTLCTRREARGATTCTLFFLNAFLSGANSPRGCECQGEALNTSASR